MYLSVTRVAPTRLGSNTCCLAMMALWRSARASGRALARAILFTWSRLPIQRPRYRANMTKPLSVFTGEVAPVVSGHGERWGKFTHSACADADLSDGAFRLLCAIASHGASTDATDKQLADLSALRWRSVGRALRELIARGYVHRETTASARRLTLVQVFAGTAPSAAQRQGVQIFERQPSAPERYPKRSRALPLALQSATPSAPERSSLESLDSARDKQRAAGAGPEPSGRAGRPPLPQGSPPAPASAPPGRGGDEEVDRVEVSAAIREMVERSKAEPPPARAGRSRLRSAAAPVAVPVQAEPPPPRLEDRLTAERLDHWIDEQRSPHPSMRAMAERAVSRHFASVAEFGELGELRDESGGHGCQVLPAALAGASSGLANCTGNPQNSQDRLIATEHKLDYRT